jgi:DNA polymerase III subunit delta
MNILSREDLRNQLKNKDIKPVYLLFGGETFLRDLAAKTITDIALQDAQLREFNESEISLTEVSFANAIAAAEQLPMMADKRVIKLTEVSVPASGKKDTIKEDDEKLLENYLKRPSESSVVIFVANEFDKRRKIAKLLLENSVAVEFKPLTDMELLTWAKAKEKELNTKFDDNALRYLIELVGNDVRKLTTEIEKLSTAALPDSIIGRELVESLTPNSREITNFALTDNLMAGNRQKSLDVLQKILDDGAEPLMLLGLIANHYHRLYLAKELMNEGVERKEVARIMKLPPFKQDDFLANARRSNADKLSNALKNIAETDLAIKTSKGTPRLQIEMLVYQLSA